MAPRPNWKGYLKLSLVSCPISLYPATSDRERVSFNQLNKNTGNRIRYKKVDAETGDEVESADITKGYQVDKNVYVTVEDEEIEALQVEAPTPSTSTASCRWPRSTRAISTTPYYIVPNDKVGQDAFAVIREAMRGKKMVGIGRVVHFQARASDHSRADGQGPARHDAALPLRSARREGVFRRDSRREGRKRHAEARRAHRRDQGRLDFDPSAFVDHYEEAVVDLLKSKQAGRAVPKGRAAEPPSNVINLMDALKRSISSEKEAAKETAKTQKTKVKKADDLRKQPQFKFPIEGGQAKQGKAAAKPAAKPAPAAKPKRKSA